MRVSSWRKVDRMAVYSWSDSCACSNRRERTSCGYDENARLYLHWQRHRANFGPHDKPVCVVAGEANEASDRQACHQVLHQGLFLPIPKLATQLAKRKGVQKVLWMGRGEYQQQQQQ